MKVIIVRIILLCVDEEILDRVRAIPIPRQIYDTM